MTPDEPRQHRTIVFIHGMYLTGSSWAPWVDIAAARGITCLTPSWPYHDGDPADLRAASDPALGRLTFGAVAAHLKAVIGALPEPPVLIGHSVGGLLVQKLLSDGYGAAGVAISPAPPPGIISLDPHFWRANFPHVNPFAGNRPVRMTPERFHYAFANTVARADSDAAYERDAVPESRNVPRSTLSRQARIRFRAPHRPLLFLAGDSDHLTPLPMVRRNAAAYREPVDMHVFAGRSHLLCSEPGWEQVAEFALAWVDALQTAPVREA